MTPEAFAADFILRWEDGGSTDVNKTHSLDPVDPGNWSSGKRGAGNLIGSNHGVTATALAGYRHVPVDAITRQHMRDLTIEEAARIALRDYYHAPKLDLLPWNRITASIFDFGWGAGPARAIKLLQRLIGVADDGIIGPATIAAYRTWLEKRQAAEWEGVRNGYYDRIIAADPAKAKYRNGWRNRSAYYAPDTDWWGRFAA